MSAKGLMIDYEWCTGCQSCEIACKNEHDFASDKWGIKMMEFGPFEMEPGKMEWNYMAIPTSYCDLCETRVAKGDPPTCVQHCLAGVIEYGTVTELSAKLAAKGKRAAIYIP